MMCLELMKKMMRGVRICYFIEGYCEFCFLYYIGFNFSYLLMFDSGMSEVVTVHSVTVGWLLNFPNPYVGL